MPTFKKLEAVGRSEAWHRKKYKPPSSNKKPVSEKPSTKGLPILKKVFTFNQTPCSERDLS